MVSSSRPTDSSSSRSKKSEGELGKEGVSNISWDLSLMKNQIQASRLVSIKEKIEKNRKSLQIHTCLLFDSATAVEAAPRGSLDPPESENMLSVRVGAPLCKLGGWESSVGSVEKEVVHSQEEILSSGALMFGSNVGGKSAISLVKLPYVEKIPPYTTWIFLDRNQRMAEDQSVVGRRRIYYDPHGNETLICSDSDEEIAEPEEDKHEFSEGEDQILWKALQEHGQNQEVLNILTQFIEATPSEIEERYDTIMEKYQEKQEKYSEASGEGQSEGRMFLDKTLSAALDSFDNLFCRRCLIFDCRLHGCSQGLIIPSEKQSNGFDLEENRNPCGDQCYLRRKDVERLFHDISDTSSVCGKGSAMSTGKRETAETSKMPKAIATSDIPAIPEVPSKNIGKRKVLKPESMSLGNTKPTTEFVGCADKRQKKLSPSDASPVSEDLLDSDPVSISDSTCPDSGAPSAHQFEREAIDESIEFHSRMDIGCSNNRNSKEDAEDNNINVPLVKNLFGSIKGQTAHGWNTIEKDLYLKGIEIFGKNSCLIARNLLSGLKTCMEVSNYMFNDAAVPPSRIMLTNSCLEDTGHADHDYMDPEMPPRTRIWRRRGRARKLKYTWKSAGHPSIRKRIGDGKQQSCQQYSPCGCQLMCGKQCPCMHNGTCCEKYCGCSKSCKNRFRGCHCAKSQCRSRQCPCFAAGRECDPDVCRNCWVSCGDGSLGEPPARGDGYQCGNMKLLLKQQQRILLSRSNVAGWGAYIKNPVNKNDYLGEYTGELVSHKEADKRGKIYDRANSSFLFDLNDQYVLDAYRKGDKLKFANHSSNPNCYAKVMLVAGDHRVGIFAKEHIEASEELFYDYRYGPDQAPAWARKPEGSKRDDSSVSHSRAQKIA